MNEAGKSVVQRGLWFEEFEIGTTYLHRPGRTVTEADNVLFTTLTMNTQSLHLDAAWAAAQPGFRGERLVNSMFTLSTLATGGQGVISVVANVAPADLAALCDAFFAGDLGRARAAQIKFAPLVKALFLETNPLPVKHALFRMGKIAHELRLPLVPISEAAAAKVDAAMRDYGGLL